MKQDQLTALVLEMGRIIRYLDENSGYSKYWCNDEDYVPALGQLKQQATPDPVVRIAVQWAEPGMASWKDCDPCILECPQALVGVVTLAIAKAEGSQVRFTYLPHNAPLPVRAEYVCRLNGHYILPTQSF